MMHTQGLLPLLALEPALLSPALLPLTIYILPLEKFYLIHTFQTLVKLIDNLNFYFLPFS